MEQMWPTRKHMKLKVIFKQRFMKVLSSSQTPGLVSPVYLSFQSIFPTTFTAASSELPDKLYL